MLNVRDFGAIGDGKSHPASTRFQSRAALQSVYPFATELTNELDWLGTVSAINHAGPNGTTIYLPAGNYIMASVVDGSGQITIPAGAIGGVDADVVCLKGDNGGTILQWLADLGAGKYAILHDANRTSATYAVSCPGYCEDFTMVGPQDAAINSTPVLMFGLGGADRRNLTRLNISGFWAGIEIVGGQCAYRDLHVAGCRFDFYWGDPRNQANPTDPAMQFGDMLFERCVCESAGVGAIGVHHAASISSCEFIKSFFGASPYAILKESNAGQPANDTVIYGSTFDVCQFENVGNALVSDDAPQRVAAMFFLTLRNCQFMWGPNFNLASAPADAVIDVAISAWLTIDGMNNPEQWKPGKVSILDIGQNWGTTIRGDLDTLIANCAGAAFATGDWAYYNNRLETIGKWVGQLVGVTGTPTANAVMVDDGSGNGTVHACTGTPAECVRGVLMYLPRSGGFGVIATAGPAVVASFGPVTNGQRLRTGRGGTCQTAPSNNAVVGVAVASVGAGLTGAIVRPT